MGRKSNFNGYHDPPILHLSKLFIHLQTLDACIEMQHECMSKTTVILSKHQHKPAMKLISSSLNQQHLWKHTCKVTNDSISKTRIRLIWERTGVHVLILASIHPASLWQPHQHSRSVGYSLLAVPYFWIW